jgi:DNA mismatch repair protein MutS
MAGMPREIIAKSTEILHQLELQRSSDDGMQQKIKSIPTQQLSFFHAEPDPLTEKVKEFLQSFDVNRITPIESMLKWVELKQIISKNEDSN